LIILSESDGSDSECTQDSNRESSGELIAKKQFNISGAETWKRCTPPCSSSPKLYYLPPPLLASVLDVAHQVQTPTEHDYVLDYHNQKNWAWEVKGILAKCGLHSWWHQSSCDGFSHRQAKHVVTCCLFHLERENWKSGIVSKLKLRSYVKLKADYGETEGYIQRTRVKAHRSPLARLRGGTGSDFSVYRHVWQLQLVAEILAGLPWSTHGWRPQLVATGSN